MPQYSLPPIKTTHFPVEKCVFGVSFLGARDLLWCATFFLYLPLVTTITRSTGAVDCLENGSRGFQFLASFLFIRSVLYLYFVYCRGLRGNDAGEKPFHQKLGGFPSRSGRVLCLTTALGVWSCGILDSTESVGTKMCGNIRLSIFIGSRVAACSGHWWGPTDPFWTSIPEGSYAVGQVSSASSVDEKTMGLLWSFTPTKKSIRVPLFSSELE